MNSPDNGHDPQSAVTAIHAAPAAPTQCDECNAPVDEDQRYCVVCGAHRKHVEDPAARYLSELTARSRTARATTVARSSRRPPARGRGLGLAVALALVPVAAAVGVVAERSSSNGNAKLIHALVLERQAANADAATATSAGSTGRTGGAAASADAGTAAKHGKATGSKQGTRTKAAHRGKQHVSTSKSTSIPGGTAISASPPSQAQKQAGAQATQKVQKAKGKSYVKGQQGLPTTVVVP